METHIILVRHGQIQANVDKLWHGWTDSLLTPEGRQQASLAGERLAREHEDITAVYASPLQRTRDTAAAIATALDHDVEVHEDLKEYGIGELEGVSFSDLHKVHKFFEKITEDQHYAPDGGESFHDVSNRVTCALKELAAKHPGEKIVAVSHGAAMALALASILHNDPYAWDKYFFHNTGVTELIMSDDPQLIRFNCYAHLGETA
ncbi:MAG: histidine phosphatase family protein [Pseudomonadales bacterium]|nr:histidine phosphatase family protein [Pseudomonadales bacterium]